VVVNDLDLFDVDVAGPGAADGRVGVDAALVGGFHGLGGERLAVVENHILVQAELPGQVVDLLPRFDQHGDHLGVLTGGEEPLHDVDQHGVLEHAIGELRVHRVRFFRQANGQRARLLRICRPHHHVRSEPRHEEPTGSAGSEATGHCALQRRAPGEFPTPHPR
jgi:hypothetical protein